MNKRTFRLMMFLGALLLVLTACNSQTGPAPTATLVADPNALAIAASPEMAPLLSKLADQFNTDIKGKTGYVPVKIISASPSDMVSAALAADPAFQALESAWRGLFFLSRRLETGDRLKIFIPSTTSGPPAMRRVRGAARRQRSATWRLRSRFQA